MYVGVVLVIWVRLQQPQTELCDPVLWVLVSNSPPALTLWCNREYYHWWELPQASFLSRQKFCVCRNKHVCRDKTRLLLRQKYACHDKRFVVTKLCLSWQNIFVATKVSLWTNICRDKRCVLSQQTRVHWPWDDGNTNRYRSVSVCPPHSHWLLLCVQVWGRPGGQRPRGHDRGQVPKDGGECAGQLFHGGGAGQRQKHGKPNGERGPHSFVDPIKRAGSCYMVVDENGEPVSWEPGLTGLGDACELVTLAEEEVGLYGDSRHCAKMLTTS